jgi:hypothetical protein
MIIILSALVSLLSFRFRGRASLELELIALRHQVTVLRRQRPSRPRLGRTPTSSASLARCAASASITSTSSVSVTCAACCRPTFSITTKRERISRSTRIVRRAARYTHSVPARSSRSHRSAVCIFATNVARLKPLVAAVMVAGFGVEARCVLQTRRSTAIAPTAQPRWLMAAAPETLFASQRIATRPSSVARLPGRTNF